MSDSNTGNFCIDFHVNLGVYTHHHEWVTEWMKEVHPHGYENYIERYSDQGAFEELLERERVDYACVLAELSHVTTSVCTNEQVRAISAMGERG